MHLLHWTPKGVASMRSHMQAPEPMHQLMSAVPPPGTLPEKLFPSFVAPSVPPSLSLCLASWGGQIDVGQVFTSSSTSLSPSAMSVDLG